MSLIQREMESECGILVVLGDTTRWTRRRFVPRWIYALLPHSLATNPLLTTKEFLPTPPPAAGTMGGHDEADAARKEER